MTTPFTDALVQGATWTLLGGGLWLLALVVAAAVESVSGGRVRALHRIGCPAAWRPGLLWALGTALSLGTITSAPASAAAEVAGPPVPVRPVDGPAPALPRVVVVGGDSLWSLVDDAAPGASPARVQRLVEHAHRLNRAVIGPDPDLLHPGQRLRLPPTNT